MRKGLSLFAMTVGLAVPAFSDDLASGIALCQQGQYARAEGVLRKATGTDASAYLALSLAKQKKYAEAEAPANAALAAKKTHEVAAAALGESLVGQKKYDDAINRLSSVLQAKSDAAYAYFWRAQAYQNKKQVARMVEDYQSFLKLAPQAPEAPSVKVLLAGLQ